MYTVVFDIETAANKHADAYWSQKRFEAPANYKDPEKIKAAIEEKRFEATKKSGLAPWTGRVTCIVAFDGVNSKSFYGENEVKILKDFGEFISNYETVLVGKNSKTFDVGFLIGRYMAHDLGIPRALRPVDVVRDINDCFGYSSQGIRGSLSDYAFMLGIDGKTAHGSEAQSMFDEAAINPEKWNDLVKYCEQDVKITFEFLKRYNKIFEVSYAPSNLEVPF